ncbi:hypothetical protein J1N35_037770 [Gossypium stocksii]|uniref:RNase H type-1 domain-containing protein n=1 Tax=Gossypium stocksii TaxID=47602 RepID=A0A9D3UKE3_9ROSI|nr:hypothetical protein J1N35_037770 [Gossypium stocksii]
MDSFPKCIMDEHNNALMGVFKEEVVDAVKSIEPLKAPEGFSRLINIAKREGRLLGARISRSNILVSHLFFADDNILFGEVSREGANNMKRVIQEYEKILSQLVNFEKSLIYFSSNVDVETQGWKIIIQPDCLFARAMKSKYFPKGEFMSAELGFYPSYTWPSIWGAKYLLEEGIGWRIGDCNSVNIWNDRWIPGHGNGRIRCQQMDIRYCFFTQQVLGGWEFQIPHAIEIQIGGNDPLIVEERACLQDVTLAEELGFRDICVEGDTLSIIRKLNFEEEDRSSVRSLI